MNIDVIVATLREQTKKYELPLVDQIIQEYGKDPFLILISCLLSLRAKDSTTIHVCRKLFERVRSPRSMVALPCHELEKLIYQSGFYKTKARVLQDVSHVLLDRFKGKVPSSYDELIAIKGIGPKTANLVVAQAFGTPAICVDTHVHRISNRLGLIRTSNVERTEAALRKILPKKYWTEWNRLLVMWGQNICTPRFPWCSRCALARWCKRVGVMRAR